MTEKGETMEQRRHRLMNVAPAYEVLLGYCANIELALETLQEENRNKMEELRRSLNNKADLLQLSNSSLNQRLMNHWDAEKKALAQLGTMHIQLQLLENECEAIKKQRDDAEAFKASMKESYEQLENQYDEMKKQRDEARDALAETEDDAQVEHQKYLTSQDKVEQLEKKLDEHDRQFRSTIVDLLAKNSDLNDEARTFRNKYADQAVELAEVRGRLVDMQANYHELRLKMWRQRMDGLMQRPLAEVVNLQRPTTPDFKGIDECCKTVCPPSPKKPRIQPKVWVKETQEAEEELEKQVFRTEDDSIESASSVCSDGHVCSQCKRAGLDLVVESSSSEDSDDEKDAWSEDVLED
jgi:chromosome segregation ATPase